MNKCILGNLLLNMAAWQPSKVLRNSLKTLKQRYYITEFDSFFLPSSRLNELKFVFPLNEKQFRRKIRWKIKWTQITSSPDRETRTWRMFVREIAMITTYCFEKSFSASINTKQENAQFSDSPDSFSILLFSRKKKLFFSRYLNCIDDTHSKVFCNCNKALRKDVYEKTIIIKYYCP